MSPGELGAGSPVDAASGGPSGAEACRREMAQALTARAREKTSEICRNREKSMRDASRIIPGEASRPGCNRAILYPCLRPTLHKNQVVFQALNDRE